MIRKDNVPNRRQFLDTAALATLTLPIVGSTQVGGATPADATQTGKWYESAYRRAVIDMHIPDWDPTFLSKFDPDKYADMLVKSRSESIVCYCQSHVGLFNYPTKVGQQHRGWHAHS